MKQPNRLTLPAIVNRGAVLAFCGLPFCHSQVLSLGFQSQWSGVHVGWLYQSTDGTLAEPKISPHTIVSRPDRICWMLVSQLLGHDCIDLLHCFTIEYTAVKLIACHLRKYIKIVSYLKLAWLD